MASPTRIESISSTDGQQFDGQLFVPEAGHGPGILLLQEIFGVGEFLVAKAEALTALGYVVLCPDVFWRIERNVALPHDDASMGRAFELVTQYSSLDPVQNGADLGQALAHLAALPEVDGGKVAAMGYCLGGRLAYELAVAAEPDACVSYYGSGVADRLDDADKVTCPAIFHFGAQDGFIPVEQAHAVAAAYADRSDVQVLIDPDAGHAFENLFSSTFGNPEAAERSWAATVAFLQRVLPA